jgi:hypothetical protein
MSAQTAEVLVQITAPHFVAGLIQRDGVVTKAAPIIKYMTGWRIEKVRTYCAGKSWSVRVLLVSVGPAGRSHG